jgi:hypothetical protein
MSEKEVKLILTAEDNISDVIKKVSDHLGASGLGQAITATSTAFLAIKGAAEVVGTALEKVNAIVQEGINDAANAELVNKRLAISMANVGDYTTESFIAINEWAGALETANGISDEAIRSQVSLGLQYGMSTEQAKKATQAAIDLAAATGTDMETAFRQLSMTLDGSAGRMGKFIPELRNLTKEQLQNGDAIDVIAKKYNGFSAQTANTYAGAQRKIESEIGNVKEAFGRLIAQNPAYIASMQSKAAMIHNVSEEVDKLSTYLLQNGTAIGNMAKAVGTTVAIVGAYYAGIKLAALAQTAWASSTMVATTTQKALELQTIMTTSTVRAQEIMDKASAAVKAVLSGQVLSQIVAEKSLQGSLIAGLVIQKARQAADTAMIAIKGMLSAETIKNTAVEAANKIALIASNAATTGMASVTGFLLAARQALTLESLKNTAVTIGNTIAQAAAAVATGALAVGIGLVTAAQWALNIALNASPIGLVVIGVAALTYAIYKLYQNFDLVTGAIKMGLGKALEWIMIPLSALMSGVGTLISAFNADWGKAIETASARMNSYALELQKSGQAQMDLANNTKKTGTELSTMGLTAARATDGISAKMAAAAQEIAKLQNAFGKAMEGAQTAFSALKDLSPRMSLDMFNVDAKAWTKSIEDLKKNGADLKLKLGLQPQDAAVKAELEKINQQISYAEEATKALRIKKSQEVRGATLKEEEIRLAQIKDRELSVSGEIMMMRIDNVKAIRDRSIAIETERILKSRGLASQDAQAGVSVKEQAWMDANAKEMSAFNNHLELQKQTAVGVEAQKQLALASLKASAMSGDTAGGMQAKNDVEVQQATDRAAILKQMKDSDKISESDYQNELTAIRIQAMTSRTNMEVALNTQRIAQLGISPEAQQIAIENAKIQNAAEEDILREKYDNTAMTDEEFKAAELDRELTHKAALTAIEDDFSKKREDRDLKNGDKWGAFLETKARLTRDNGAVIGSMMAFQQSEYGKTLDKGLSDASTLMGSKNIEMFKIGQAAAIAQAAIQIPMSAISAYTSMASIPIVGPALGIAAAAAAIAAGSMNIAKIKAQRPPGGAAHGGMDEIPKSMDNSSFILKAGERVVAPNQNQDLVKAVDKINNGGASGHTVNISVNGSADSSTIENIKRAVMDGLREASERGVPVINSRGIVNA